MPTAVLGVERCVGVAGGELPSMLRAKGLSRPAAAEALMPSGLGSGLDTTLISTSASEEDMFVSLFVCLFMFVTVNVTCSNICTSLSFPRSLFFFVAFFLNRHAVLAQVANRETSAPFDQRFAFKFKCFLLTGSKSSLPLDDDDDAPLLLPLPSLSFSHSRSTSLPLSLSLCACCFALSVWRV